MTNEVRVSIPPPRDLDPLARYDDWAMRQARMIDLYQRGELPWQQAEREWRRLDAITRGGGAIEFARREQARLDELRQGVGVVDIARRELAMLEGLHREGLTPFEQARYGVGPHAMSLADMDLCHEILERAIRRELIACLYDSLQPAPGAANSKGE